MIIYYYRTQTPAKHPRIVYIEGIEIEAEFAPHMLYAINDDKPAFIGRLGTPLGESKVNITTFHLGRDAPGGSAIALVQVGRPIAAELIGKIVGFESMMQAKLSSGRLDDGFRGYSAAARSRLALCTT